MMDNVFKQGENLAESMRKKLELDNAPIKNIFTLLENQGIMVIRMPIKGGSLSGAVVCNKEDKSAYILINSNRSVGHQSFTAAHEYCHYLEDMEETSVIIDNSNNKSPIEKRADSFAANFLMPKEGIINFIDNVLKKQVKKIDDEDIVRIREEFGVSWSAVIYRLNNLGYTFDKSVNDKVKQTASLNSLALQFGFSAETPDNENPIKFPSSYYKLAYSAYFDKKISLERLSEILLQSYEDTVDQVNNIKNKTENE